MATIKTVPFMAPWGAPTASPSVRMDAAFLAPPEMGGLPYLAPSTMSLDLPAPVLASGQLAYFAPPLVDGLAFLAPQFVPVTFVLPESMSTGGRARATRRSASVRKSSPAPAEVPYHSRAYEQDARAALELDDEETVIAFLMELALHV